MKTRNFQVVNSNFLRISTIFTSSLNNFMINIIFAIKSFSLFYQCYFLDNLILSESKGFTVRQNCLLSVRSCSFKFIQQLVFVFRKSNTQYFICLFYSRLLLSELVLRYIFQTASRHKGLFYGFIYKWHIVSSGILFLLWCKFIQSLNTYLKKRFHTITVNSNIFS